jgi:hypothetical protein
MRLISLCTLAAGAMLITSAAMAAATAVNIADPNAASRIAKVDVGNRLAVQEVPPSTYFHAANYDLTNSDGCFAIAMPPSGKSLVIRQVRVDVWKDPTPGQGQYVGIYPNGSCSGADVGEVNPAGFGQTIVPFDPGLAVPNGSSLGLFVGGNVGVVVYVDGYQVPSAVAPEAGGQVLQLSGTSRQRR